MGDTGSFAPGAVAVLGAGAVGCYFGAKLAHAGVGVTLIGRPAHVEAIERDGVCVQQDGRNGGHACARPPLPRRRAMPTSSSSP